MIAFGVCIKCAVTAAATEFVLGFDKRRFKRYVNQWDIFGFVKKTDYWALAWFVSNDLDMLILSLLCDTSS